MTLPRRGAAIFILLLLLGLIASEVGTAQPIRIVRTDPDSAAVSVELRKRIEFHTSKPLPFFGTAFLRKFIRPSNQEARLIAAGHALGETLKLTIVFWELDHQPDTDFAFIVYGLRADSVDSDGSVLDRPFTLNYTTADAWGEGRISGAVALGSRTLPPASGITRRLLTERLRSVLAHSMVSLSPAISGSAKHRISADSGPAPPSPMALPAGEPDLGRTVVVLLDVYDRDIRDGGLRRAAVPDETGAFVFEGVRDGAYFPVAFSFADEDGERVVAYGFFDPDGDLNPDPIRVDGDSLAGIDLTLFPLEPATARTLLEIATREAGRYAPDQQLIEIADLSTLHTDPRRRDDGQSLLWRYAFHSSSTDSVTFVDVDPINLAVTRVPASEYGPVGQVVPPTFIDSDRAVEIADANGGNAFRDHYAPEEITVAVRGGDLPLFLRPEQGRVFWEVFHSAPSSFQPQPFLRTFIDMDSGEMLAATPVNRERDHPDGLPFTLGPTHPNPFRTATEIRFTLERPTRVSLAVYDLLGRRVATLAEGLLGAGLHSAAWRPGNAPAGAYLVRLETPHGTAVRQVTKYE